MAKVSAGILLFRRVSGGLEVLLVHPGGPFWAKRDLGSWSIPKGEVSSHEEEQAVAVREFREELGSDEPVRIRPPAEWIDLGSVLQAGGKRVRAWAVEGDLDVSSVRSNTFELEWPPRSGQHHRFPEVDRAGWFRLDDARERLVAGQVPLLERLAGALGGSGAPAGGD